MPSYDTLPAAVIGQFEKFDVHIPDEKLSQFRVLIKNAPIGPVTWENQQEDRRFGVSRQWLIDAAKTWEESFDWYAFLAQSKNCFG
jgi:microsomal epoxide hydrolase